MPDRNPLDQSLKNSAESVADIARAATQTVDDARQTAAERLGSAASAVGDRADQLPGGQKVQQFAQAAAERLSTTADYVRTHDAKRMLADVEGVVSSWGNVEPIDKRSCRLQMSVDDLQWPAMVLAAVGSDFEIVGPPELRDHVRQIAELFARAH